MFAHPFLRRLFDSLLKRINNGESNVQSPSGNGGYTSRDLKITSDDRLNGRMSFDALFNVLFLLALHGSSAPKILLIIYVNFLLATRLDRKYVPVATWVFNIAILFANELARGYSYAQIANSVLPSVAEDDTAVSWATYLDSYGGLQPRWDVHFNVTVLRLISFNFDYIWAGDRSGSSSPVEVWSSPIHIS